MSRTSMHDVGVGYATEHAIRAGRVTASVHRIFRRQPDVDAAWSERDDVCAELHDLFASAYLEEFALV